MNPVNDCKGEPGRVAPAVDCHACQLCIAACPEEALRLAPLRSAAAR